MCIFLEVIIAVVWQMILKYIEMANRLCLEMG